MAYFKWVYTLEEYLAYNQELRDYDPQSIIDFLAERYTPLQKSLPLSGEDNNGSLIISKIMEEETKTVPETPGEWTPPEEPGAPAEEGKDESI